jgi:hypothetical protein
MFEVNVTGRWLTWLISKAHPANSPETAMKEIRIFNFMIFPSRLYADYAPLGGVTQVKFTP